MKSDDRISADMQDAEIAGTINRAYNATSWPYPNCRLRALTILATILFVDDVDQRVAKERAAAQIIDPEIDPPKDWVQLWWPVATEIYSIFSAEHPRGFYYEDVAHLKLPETTAEKCRDVLNMIYPY